MYNGALIGQQKRKTQQYKSMHQIKRVGQHAERPKTLPARQSPCPLRHRRRGNPECVEQTSRKGERRQGIILPAALIPKLPDQTGTAQRKQRQRQPGPGPAMRVNKTTRQASKNRSGNRLTAWLMIASGQKPGLLPVISLSHRA